jgi:hypothetical protein
MNDVYGQCVHGENMANCYDCRDILESGCFDYFFKIYERCGLEDKDLFKKKNINDMSLDSALKLIDIIESVEHIKVWEKSLVIRIKDIHGII